MSKALWKKLRTVCVFQMNECRVQRARMRKGLDDYPCKSGGLVEYTRFAEGVDDRIKNRMVLGVRRILILKPGSARGGLA